MQARLDWRRKTVLLALAICLGCSTSGEFPTAPVKGKVTYKGAPVPTGTVMFVPDNGPAATGQIEKDGTYVLGTYGITDGAVLGMHKIAITALEDMAGKLPEEQSGTPAPIVPNKYLSQDSSGLTAEVKADGNEFNFELKD